MSQLPSKSRRAQGPAASMDSFVDFESGHRSGHRMGISSPLSYFRGKKKSSTMDTSNAQNQLVTARSLESLDTAYKGTSSKTRALPPIPRLASDPTGLSQASIQGTYAPLRLSPQSDLEFDPNSLRPSDSAESQVRNNDRYDGLPHSNNIPAPVPLRANHGPPVSYPNAPEPPSNPFNAALQRHGQPFVEASDMLDRELAPSLFLAEGLKQSPQDKKAALIKIGNLIAHGTEHLARAQETLNTCAESPVWQEGKEFAQNMMEPAKDMMVILDAVSVYVPMLVIAKSLFTTIMKKELEKRDNDKNMTLVCFTVTSFWYSLCDLKVLFDMPLTIHDEMQAFITDVNKKMEDLGNFRSLYHKHGHIARTLKSGTYKSQINEFITAFKDFQAKLQFILTEVSALTINRVDNNVANLSHKVDMLLELVSRKTPTEERISAKIEAFGGEERAFHNSRFLSEIAENLGMKLTPQIRTILRTDLNEQLQSNMAMFQLEIKESQKELEQAMERSTDVILMQLESGPHELVKDEDIRQIWKDMKWRLSCKTRHFVDALHHHFANIFAKHRKTTGESHPEQWTLKLIGKIIFHPAIGDAIDTDGSGYISVHEVNHFSRDRPKGWSVPVTLAYAAAGWYQNALVYRARCIVYMNDIQHYARRMLPQNRKHFKPYLQKGCLPEIWYMVESLHTDMLRYQGGDLLLQFEKLTKYREEIMDTTVESLQRRLDAVRYQLDSPEGIKAVLSTSRTELYILPLLSLVLERHLRIVEMADNLILSEREFENMITSVQSVAYAFGIRYSNLTEGWRQQRLDVPLQIRCFANGMFESWHEHFSSVPYDQEFPNPHSQILNNNNGTDLWSVTRNSSILSGPGTSKTLPPKPTEFLIYGLPPQPSADELRRLRVSVKPKKPEDSRAKERYGHVSSRARAKRNSYRRSGVPKSPTIKINDEEVRDVHPDRNLPRLQLRVPDVTITPFHQFEFEDEHEQDQYLSVNDGYNSADSDFPDVPHIKTPKMQTLEERMKSVEAELGGMKDMLVQLLAISKQSQVPSQNHQRKE